MCDFHDTSCDSSGDDIFWGPPTEKELKLQKRYANRPTICPQVFGYRQSNSPTVIEESFCNLETKLTPTEIWLESPQPIQESSEYAKKIPNKNLNFSLDSVDNQLDEDLDPIGDQVQKRSIQRVLESFSDDSIDHEVAKNDIEQEVQLFDNKATNIQVNLNDAADFRDLNQFVDFRQKLPSDDGDSTQKICLKDLHEVGQEFGREGANISKNLNNAKDSKYFVNIEQELAIENTTGNDTAQMFCSGGEMECELLFQNNVFIENDKECDSSSEISNYEEQKEQHCIIQSDLQSITDDSIDHEMLNVLEQEVGQVFDNEDENICVNLNNTSNAKDLKYFVNIEQEMVIDNDVAQKICPGIEMECGHTSNAPNYEEQKEKQYSIYSDLQLVTDDSKKTDICLNLKDTNNAKVSKFFINFEEKLVIDDKTPKFCPGEKLLCESLFEKHDPSDMKCTSTSTIKFEEQEDGSDDKIIISENSIACADNLDLDHVLNNIIDESVFEVMDNDFSSGHAEIEKVQVKNKLLEISPGTVSNFVDESLEKGFDQMKTFRSQKSLLVNINEVRDDLFKEVHREAMNQTNGNLNESVLDGSLLSPNNLSFKNLIADMIAEEKTIIKVDTEPSLFNHNNKCLGYSNNESLFDFQNSCLVSMKLADCPKSFDSEENLQSPCEISEYSFAVPKDVVSVIKFKEDSNNGASSSSLTDVESWRAINGYPTPVESILNEKDPNGRESNNTLHDASKDTKNKYELVDSPNESDSDTSFCSLQTFLAFEKECSSEETNINFKLDDNSASEASSYKTAQEKLSSDNAAEANIEGKIRRHITMRKRLKKKIRPQKRKVVDSSIYEADDEASFMNFRLFSIAEQDENVNPKEMAVQSENLEFATSEDKDGDEYSESEENFHKESKGCQTSFLQEVNTKAPPVALINEVSRCKKMPPNNISKCLIYKTPNKIISRPTNLPKESRVLSPFLSLMTQSQEKRSRIPVASKNNFKNIVSPIAKYIRDSPVPPLVKNVWPKSSVGNKILSQKISEPRVNTPSSLKKTNSKLQAYVERHN